MFLSILKERLKIMAGLLVFLTCPLYSQEKTVPLSPLKDERALEIQRIQQEIQREIKDYAEIQQNLLGSICALVIIAVILMVGFIIKVIQRKGKIKPELHQFTSISDKTEGIKEVELHFDLNSPERLIKRIVKKMSKEPNFNPRLIEYPRNIAVATDKGNVRKQNQDCAAAFAMGGVEVLIEADGMGGSPYGAEAARFAVETAAETIIRILGSGITGFKEHPDTLALIALHDAFAYIRQKGAEFNLNNGRGGLRTTLIIVIGTPNQYGYAYIGDGGGFIVRDDQKIEKFLIPQKAPNQGPNVLAASLGPVLDGQPVFGTVSRQANDLLMIGSDGIFDYVDQSSLADIYKLALDSQGDLRSTAKIVVSHLASKKDFSGYICTDNLTLGLLGTEKTGDKKVEKEVPVVQTKDAQVMHNRRKVHV